MLSPSENKRGAATLCDYTKPCDNISCCEKTPLHEDCTLNAIISSLDKNHLYAECSSFNASLLHVDEPVYCRVKANGRCDSSSSPSPSDDRLAQQVDPTHPLMKPEFGQLAANVDTNSLVWANVTSSGGRITLFESGTTGFLL